jgi:hypothetical protein
VPDQGDVPDLIDSVVFHPRASWDSRKSRKAILPNFRLFLKRKLPIPA